MALMPTRPRRRTMPSELLLLAMLPVASIAAPSDGDPVTGPRLSVEQLKGRYGDIFGFETSTMEDNRAYCAAHVKTLPEP